MGFDPRQVLVSCEHASNRVPEKMDAPEELLQLHIAWDPGALFVAEHLSKRFEAPLHRGEYSRPLLERAGTSQDQLDAIEFEVAVARALRENGPVSFPRSTTPVASTPIRKLEHGID